MLGDIFGNFQLADLVSLVTFKVCKKATTDVYSNDLHSG